MKKIIISIVSNVIVASLLAVTVFAFTSLSNKGEEDTSELDQLLANTKGENGHFSVSSLNYQKLFSDFSPENLNAIMDVFDKIIDENETVEIACTLTTFRYFRNNGIEMPKELAKLDPIYGIYNEHDVKNSEIATVSTDMDRNALKYAMLISVYALHFPENVCYGAPFEMKNSILQDGLSSSCKLVISFDYKDYGYEDIRSYFTDVKTGKIFPGEKTYYISETEIDIISSAENRRAQSNGISGDYAPNLLEELNPNCKRICNEKKNCFSTVDRPLEN